MQAHLQVLVSTIILTTLLIIIHSYAIHNSTSEQIQVKWLNYMGHPDKVKCAHINTLIQSMTALLESAIKLTHAGYAQERP